MKRASLAVGPTPRRTRCGVWLGLLLAALLGSMPGALAAETDEALFARGEEALGKGDFDTAIKVMTEFATTRTASVRANEARYKLAYAHFLKGNGGEAIKILTPLSVPTFPNAAIREASTLMLAQAFGRQAETQKDPKAKNADLDKSIGTFDDFLKTYVKSEARDEAMFGRAAAKMFRGLYDDAIKDVDGFQQLFPKSMQIPSSHFLRARILAAKAATQMKSGQKDDGAKTLQQSKTLFIQLMRPGADMAVASEAAISAAQMWYDQKLYSDAIFFYRQVRPKAEIILSQQAKVTVLNDNYSKLVVQYRAAGGINAPAVVKFKEYLQQEVGKLESIKRNPDLYISSWIGTGVCYMAQELWQEADILVRHLLGSLPAEATKEDKKFTIDTIFRVQMGLQNVEEARKFYDQFQQEFPKDPIAQDNGILLAKLYWMKERPDDALVMCDRILADYPNTPAAEESVVTKSSILVNKGETQKALEQIDAYKKAYVGKGKFVGQITHRQAQVYRQLNRLDEALKSFKEVRDKYPDEEFIDDANLQVGATLVALKRFDDAVTELTQFKERFATSALLPSALLQLGEAYSGKVQIALEKNDAAGAKESLKNAVSAYKEVITRAPTDPQTAPMAQYRIGMAYFQAKEFDLMTKAFQELSEKFKDSPLRADAHFWVGYNYQVQNKNAEAAAEFEIVAKNFPASGVASEASLRVGQSWAAAAGALGRSRALMAPDKAKLWDDAVAKALTAYEQTMANFAEAPVATTATSGILELLSSKLRAKLIDGAGVEKYYNDLLAGSAGKNTVLKVNALFALGNLQNATGDPKRALVTFERAVKEGPDVPLDTISYEAYAKALIDNAKYAEAVGIYQKMADVSKRAGEWPAWAEAQYGIGYASFMKKDSATARKQFAMFTDVLDGLAKGKLKPDKLGFEERALANCKKKADAQLGMADILLQESKFTDAFTKYKEYVDTTRGVSKARARAVLGMGHSLMGRAAQTPDQAAADYEAAYSNFARAADLYLTFDDIVGEAMYMSGLAQEKLNRPDDARKIYEGILKGFPNDPNAAKAKDALAKLPPPQPAGKK
ncbi:MAG: tetratricopeptide repeat protein [Verrucomicrobia bacterium]|nr:tetratricopeptide repeat protein [Verrucomicrobiota bacterium]